MLVDTTMLSSTLSKKWTMFILFHCLAPLDAIILVVSEESESKASPSTVSLPLKRR